MCDKIIKKNLTKDEIPEYVYKRVQELDGELLSPVMGEHIPFKEWAKAPKRVDTFQRTKNLISQLTFPSKWKKSFFPSSSYFTKVHNGKWGVFKNLKDALRSTLVCNFIDADGGHRLPTQIVKCKIKGKVHQTSFNGDPTFLASRIKIVEIVRTNIKAY